MERRVASRGVFEIDKASMPFFTRGPHQPPAELRCHYLYDQSHRSLCLRAALCGGRALAVTIGYAASPLYTSNGTSSLLCNLTDVIGELLPSKRPESSSPNVARDVFDSMISHSRLNRID